MKPEPPRLLSNWLGSGGLAGMTENQQVMPGLLNRSSDAQVPLGVGSRPMFSMATLNLGLGAPLRSVTGAPFSMAFLSKAYSCAPLKPPPPMPGADDDCGNSS